MDIKKQLSAVLAIIFLIGIIVNNCANRYKLNAPSVEYTDSIGVDSAILLQDSIKQFIKSMNISHADIVYAQAVLESDNFKSKIFLENNNMFGMKEAMVRNTVALGTKNGFAYYKSPLHSVIDYALYQATYYHDGNRRVSRQVYLERLAKNYASDPNYIRKLNKIINSLE